MLHEVYQPVVCVLVLSWCFIALLEDLSDSIQVQDWNVLRGCLLRRGRPGLVGVVGLDHLRQILIFLVNLLEKLVEAF